MINRGEPHRFVPLQGGREPIHIVAFRGDVLGSSVPSESIWFPNAVLFDDAITNRLRGIFDELQAPLWDTDSRARLFAALDELVARHSATQPEPPSDAPMSTGSVRRLRVHLERHATERMSLAEMARVAMLSRFHLIRAFEREVGVSPRAYQMLLRLARALTLLAEGASLSFATFESGFADQAHMTRHFRRCLNVTPGEYARQTAPVTIKRRESICRPSIH
jgi:AraC-like DNA-binding protein